MAYEAYWDDVTVALRLNGTLPVTCDKGNTVTNVGVTLGSYGADSGGVAAQIDSDADYLLIPGGAINTFGIAPLTVAFSFTASAVTGYRVLWAFGDFGWSTSTLAFFIDSGYLKFYLLDPGTGGNAGYNYGSQSVAPVSADTTYKVMFCRDGRTLRVFVDGGLAYLDTAFYKSDATPGDPEEFAIGAGHDIYIGNDVLMEGGFRGSIDEFYIVKGVALESAPYTPAPLFIPGGGTATGVATLPITVDVTAAGAVRLPLVVSAYQAGTASAGILVNAISPALASGAATVADSASGAARWSPVVELAGVDVTADVVGEITVEASEGAARIASFSLLASGPLNLPGYTGQRVTIDIADSAGGNRLRLFTGLVDVPAVDLVRRLVRITANDDLMNTVNAMDRAAIESLVGGRWSKVVFDDGAVPWSYTQDRLSTVAASLDMDANGALRLTPWAAKASADLSFDASVILEQSIAVDTAERGALVNEVMVNFGYRFPMAKREAYEIHFEFMTNGFGPWVNDGNAFLVRSTVQSAIEAAGFAIDTLDFVPLPTTPQLIGGAAMWLPNPATDPLLALGFDATVTFDYTQSVQEQHAIRVYSQASLDAVGRLPASLSGALEGKTVDTVAAETAAVLYQNEISKIPSQLAAPTVAGSTTAAVMDLTADTNRAAAEAAMACLIDVAKVKIVASHRSGRVSAALALHPLVDLDKTVAVDADGVQAKGKVVRVLHRMDADSAQALTEFEIAVARLDGSGLAHVDTSTTAPAGVADGVTATLGDPVCTFNGLAGQDQQFSVAFPGVDSAERDLRPVDIASEYNVSIIEDDLVVTL